MREAPPGLSRVLNSLDLIESLSYSYNSRIVLQPYGTRLNAQMKTMHRNGFSNKQNTVTAAGTLTLQGVPQVFSDWFLGCTAQ